MYERVRNARVDGCWGCGAKADADASKSEYASMFVTFILYCCGRAGRGKYTIIWETTDKGQVLVTLVYRHDED
jgi:hypothetical protein